MKKETDWNKTFPITVHLSRNDLVGYGFIPEYVAEFTDSDMATIASKLAEAYKSVHLYADLEIEVNLLAEKKESSGDMDYLLYGSVKVKETDNGITIIVSVEKAVDEPVVFYQLSPGEANQLAYQQMADVTLPERVSTNFTVPENTLFLFEIAATSNESDIPIEAVFAVYNTDVVQLSQEDAMLLSGVTTISPDGQRFKTE